MKVEIVVQIDKVINALHGFFTRQTANFWACVYEFLKLAEQISILVHPLDKKVIKRANLPTGKRDPEPCLSDFHEPFHGEAVPMTLDSKDFKAKIAEKFYQQDPDWRQKFLANRTKFQDDFKR